MNRLQAEVRRLYLPAGASTDEPPGARIPLAAADGRVRAMVLSLSGPAPWEALSKLWQGVQADLEWPAPAIAVAGEDGYQLWFSLAEPIAAADAASLLARLRDRYLAGVAPQRIRCETTQASVPPLQLGPERWSAFVTPDLAALFADDPWLDLPPGADAQADLLSRLQSTKAADVRRALARPAAGSQQPSASASPSPPQQQDPRRFLLDVMNDPQVDLRLRIEAAKALLPSFEHRQP